MVRITAEGEILPDGDPRVRSQGHPAPDRAAAPTERLGQIRYGGAQPAAPPTQSTSAFDWSAPPVRVVREPPGQALFGLPALEVFGALLRSQHLVLLAGMMIFFGWRGVVMGVILWVVWTLSGAGAPAAAAASRQARPAGQRQQQGDGGGAIGGLAGMVQNFFGSPPAGRREYVSRYDQPQSGPAAPAGRPASAPRSADPWALKGQGHKLGAS